MSHDFLFKLILVGDSSVGKTALLHRFTDPTFRPSPSACEATVGVDFKTKNISIHGKQVMLMTWDTAGQEAYRSFTRAYFRGSAVVLLVYDVGNRASFANIPAWLEDLKESADNPNLTLVLVGNKNDSEEEEGIGNIGIGNRKQVETNEGAEFAAKNNLLFFETSAKTGENVDLCFTSGAENFYTKFQAGLVDISSDAQGLTLGPRQINAGGRWSRCGC